MIKSRFFIFGLIALFASIMLSFLYLRFLNPIDLDVPELELKPGYLLEWDAVEHADYYQVYVNDIWMDQTDETYYDFEDINPYLTQVFKVEAYSNQKIYQKSENHISFDIKDYNNTTQFNHGLNFNGIGVYGGDTPSDFGHASFIFKAPFAWEYVIQVDITYDPYGTKDLVVLTEGVYEYVPYDESLEGYKMSLQDDQYIQIFFSDLNEGAVVYISIMLIDLVDLNETSFMLVPAHTTIKYPITPTSDTDTIQFSYGDQVALSIKDMYLDQMYRIHPFYYQNSISPLGKYIEIENTSDETQAVFVQKERAEMIAEDTWIEVEPFIGRKIFVLDDYPYGLRNFEILMNKANVPYQVSLYVLNYVGVNEMFSNIEFSSNLLESSWTSSFETGHYAILIVLESHKISEEISLKTSLD